MHTETECFIAAGAPRVWELVTDIELPTRFSPELRRVNWLGGATEPALGARFEGHNHNDFLGEWRTESHIVEFEPLRLFAWAVVDPDGRFGDEAPDPARPVATWTYELAAEAGGVRVRHAVRLGPARSGLSLVIDSDPGEREAIVANRLAYLRGGMAATVQGLRTAVEG